MALARTPPIMYLYHTPRPIDESDRTNTNNEQANNTPRTQLNQDNRSEHWNLYSDRSARIAGRESGRDNNREDSPKSVKPEAEIDRAKKEQLSGAHGRLKKGIEIIEAKADRCEKSADKFESDWEGVVNRVEGAESNMAGRGTRLDEMKQTRVNHSARIHALEDELRNVRFQNDAIKKQLIQRGDIDESDFSNGYGRNGGDLDPYSNGHSTGQGQGYGDDQRYGNERGKGKYGLNQGEKGLARNEQHRTQHVGHDGYRGFNQIYNPAYATSYRREHASIENARTLKGEERSPPGGLYVLRFNGEGFSDVTPALRSQQSVIRSSNGFVVGLARSHNVISLEGDADWTFTSRQKPRYDIECNHRCVDDAIIMLWFPNYIKAAEYAGSTVRNKFREKHFPTSHSNESRFVELLKPPFIGELDTFLFMEFLNVAHKEFLQDRLKNFQQELEDQILKFNRDSIPLVAAYIMPSQIEMLRGAQGQMFKVNSMVFISRFRSLQAVAELWRAGIIQQARQNWGLNGPANIYAIALKDNDD